MGALDLVLWVELERQRFSGLFGGQFLASSCLVGMFNRNTIARTKADRRSNGWC
jgi:hypothetical protein